MAENSCFKGLKVIIDWKDGGRNNFPVLWNHVDKRIGESCGQAVFQFNREGKLKVGESRATRKADFENFWP